MLTNLPLTIHRQEYQPPAFKILTVEMGFDLDPVSTIVATRMRLERSPSANHSAPLLLKGEDLELLSIALDGTIMSPDAYRAQGHDLHIANLPDTCTLDIAVRLKPEQNTSLMGLYVSNGNFFTQCEAEGFRKITYFPDRPDVMTLFTVMLRADKEKFPVLLSNGNLIEQGDLGDGRHYAKWEDPFPKPCYLFALVAGQLEHIQHQLKTASGRPVLLQIYAEKRDLGKLTHAMDSLIDALRWDEKRFGLELDLKRFMIVAVGDFNMGAMENKGLNIFNTKYVLASPKTATDMDYAGIESVVGHEYFHNWTGNRVTCRDWFQLTLKEGLTVFRDQEFSSDIAAGYLEDRDDPTARAVQRIDNVRGLRAVQFSEDAGPMAHPIRPDSYQEIGNFYTATVYEKGAEVIRMLMTLLGRDGFRLGMDEYFRRHDGQAVTCDDFVAAMESVYVQQHPGKNLDVFRRWYSQAGTPRVAATGHYDADTQRYTLTLRQICPKVGMERQSQTEKKPFHIPFAFGLLDDAGEDLPLRLENEPDDSSYTTKVLDFTEAEQHFIFADLVLPSGQQPTPSLLRDFSAPVIVDYAYTDVELAQLAMHDSDAFNRWEAGQRLATRELVRLTHLVKQQQDLTLSPALIALYRSTLNNAHLDPALKELALTLPSESMVGEALTIYDPHAVHAGRQFVRQSLAVALQQDWARTYRANRTPGKYSADAHSSGQRALKNAALIYLVEAGDTTLVQQQFQQADNMTDLFAALTALLSTSHPALAQARSEALQDFYQRYKKDDLVVGKWLRAQATARRMDHHRPVLEIVASLLRHPAFSLNNPNKVYALLGAFFSSNPAEFHQPDGAAYRFWTEQVLALDAINPTVAGRMARMLDRWKKLTPELQQQAESALRKIHEHPQLSKDVAEVVGKALMP